MTASADAVTMPGQAWGLAAAVADRLVTIEESLAQLMLVMPGRRPDDRAVATVALARAMQDDDEEPAPPRKRRWWQCCS